MGYIPWGHTESDTTEVTSHTALGNGVAEVKSRESRVCSKIQSKAERVPWRTPSLGTIPLCAFPLYIQLMETTKTGKFRLEPLFVYLYNAFLESILWNSGSR